MFSSKRPGCSIRPLYSIFTCECTDKDGNIVPDASEYVSFSVSDPAVIVGTGSDNCDHNRVGLSERRMYMGKISIAVKPAHNQESIMLMAKSENCKSAVFFAQIPKSD